MIINFYFLNNFLFNNFKFTMGNLWSTKEYLYSAIENSD